MMDLNPFGIRKPERSLSRQCSFFLIAECLIQAIENTPRTILRVHSELKPLVSLQKGLAYLASRDGQTRDNYAAQAFTDLRVNLAARISPARIETTSEQLNDNQEMDFHSWWGKSVSRCLFEGLNPETMVTSQDIAKIERHFSQNEDLVEELEEDFGNRLIANSYSDVVAG